MSTKLELELNEDGTVSGTWCAVEAACPTTTAGEGGSGEGAEGAAETVTVTEVPGAEEPSAEAAVAAETTVEPAEATGGEPESAPAPEATEGEGGEKPEE